MLIFLSCSLLGIFIFYLLLLPAYLKYRRLARSPISQNAYFIALLLSPLAFLWRIIQAVAVMGLGVVAFFGVVVISVLMYPVFFYTEHLKRPSPISKLLKKWHLTNNQLFELSYELFGKRFLPNRK